MVVLLTPATLLLLLLVLMPKQLILVLLLMFMFLDHVPHSCLSAAHRVCNITCCWLLHRHLRQGRSFYRIVDRFIDQSGANTESIYGGAFKDDPGGLAMKHDRRVRGGGGRTWRCIKLGYQKDNQVDP